MGSSQSQFVPFQVEIDSPFADLLKGSKKASKFHVIQFVWCSTKHQCYLYSLIPPIRSITVSFLGKKCNTLIFKGIFRLQYSFYFTAQQVLHVQQPSEGARRDPAAGEHRALGRGRLQVRGRQQGGGQAGVQADRVGCPM